MKKILSSLVICLGITTLSFGFTDLDQSHWAYDKISAMSESGIVSGFPDGTFKPNNPVTREQAAAIMTNFFELPLKETAKTFEDIAPDYWSNQYAVLVADYMEPNEVEGKYYFRPDENATRVEIAKAIVEILGFNDEEIKEDVINGFNDKESFLEGDKKYISIVADNKVMVGDDLSCFRPNDTITRAEFCSLIYNIYSNRDELKAKNLNKVVMTVNGEDVLYGEFEMYFDIQKKLYEAMFSNENIWQLEILGTPLYSGIKDTTKVSIIDTKVKMQKAKELGIEFTAEDEKETNEYLSDDTSKSICEYYGMTLKELEEMKKVDIMIYKLANKLYQDNDDKEKVDINEKVERTYYDARHILLVTQDEPEEKIAEIYELAKTLLERVKKGEDFAKLAGEYSEDAGSYKNGGLYENVMIGQFVPEFENAALSLNPGDIYPELVESDYGYHIIKLENKKTVEEYLTEEEKLEIVNSYLYNESEKWLEEVEVVVNEEVYKAL